MGLRGFNIQGWGDIIAKGLQDRQQLDRQAQMDQERLEQHRVDTDIKKEALANARAKIEPAEIGVPAAIGGIALGQKNASPEDLVKQLGGRFENNQIILPRESAKFLNELALKRVGADAAIAVGGQRLQAQNDNPANNPYVRDLLEEQKSIRSQRGNLLTNPMAALSAKKFGMTLPQYDMFLQQKEQENNARLQQFGGQMPAIGGAAQPPAAAPVKVKVVEPVTLVTTPDEMGPVVRKARAQDGKIYFIDAQGKYRVE